MMKKTSTKRDLENPEFSTTGRFTFDTSPSQVRAISTLVGSSVIQRSVGLTGVYIIIIFGKKNRKVCLQDTNNTPVQLLLQDIAHP